MNILLKVKFLDSRSWRKNGLNSNDKELSSKKKCLISYGQVSFQNVEEIRTLLCSGLVDLEIKRNSLNNSGPWKTLTPRQLPSLFIYLQGKKYNGLKNKVKIHCKEKNKTVWLWIIYLILYLRPT